MYPNQNFYQNGYSTINNQQMGATSANTGFFSHQPVPPTNTHQQPQQHQNPYIYSTQQFGFNTFDFRHQPQPLNQMNQQSNFLPLPPPPAPPTQYQLHGFFRSAPVPLNRPISNFAGRNVIYTSTSSTGYKSASQNNHISSVVNVPPTSAISISNAQQSLPLQSTLSRYSTPQIPLNVSISDELLINTSNLSEAIFEDHNNPLGKRTVINELALAKLAKNNQQKQIEVANPSTPKENGQHPQQSTVESPQSPPPEQQQNGISPAVPANTMHSSPESLQLGGPEEDDEDGAEHPEMARNWRMLMLFTGRTLDSQLPKNCERPQNAKDIAFPYLESSKWQFPDDHEPIDMEMCGQSDEDGGIESMEGTSSQTDNKQIATRAKSLPPPPVPPVHKQTHGYVLPNGRTWVRHRPVAEDAKQKLIQLPQNGNKSALNNSTASTSKGNENPPPKRFGGFANKTLLIMKNGKRLQGGTKECYQFADTGTCQNGIFCVYEHNGNMEHAKKRVCLRLLRGLCHETGDHCPGGLHSSLLPHQMPLCDFYQRLICSKGKDACQFLHVRHTPRTEPCADFNRGNCQLGIMCDAPHRYIYHIIKQKSSQATKVINSKTTTISHTGPANRQQNERRQPNNKHPQNQSQRQQNEPLESPASPSPPLSPISLLKWIDA